MKPHVIRRGIKSIFTDRMMTRISCPECDHIDNVCVSSWINVLLIEKDGETIGVKYECPKCLCIFEYYKVEA